MFNPDVHGQKKNSMVKKHSPAIEVTKCDTQDEFNVEDLFGKVFGIERVHLLQKSDRLQDVIEKLQLVPEKKLVYVEENHCLREDASYTVHNTLTLGDLLNYLCPSSEDML